MAVNTYIRADLNQIRSTAKQVDAYVSVLNSKMLSSTGEVQFLMASWQGSDYAAFLDKWRDLNNEDSTFHGMKESLKNYSDFLNHAAKKYKDTQIDVVNASNKLLSLF